MSILPIFCESKSIPQVPVRRSIFWYQEQFELGADSKNSVFQKPLKDLLLAWEKIKDLEKTDIFFKLASYNGVNVEPSKSLESQNLYWGGYSNHGNILFPTWHRLFVRELEKKLQEANPDVTLPFWDETNETALLNHKCVPWIFTKAIVSFVDGSEILNPLVSSQYRSKVTTKPNSSTIDFTREKDYTTVRYPNLTKGYRIEKDSAEALKGNIIQWLTGILPDPTSTDGVEKLFKKSFLTDNYVLFSNSTSAAAYNLKNKGKSIVVSLEQPSNDILLAVGGFTSNINITDATPSYDVDGIIAGSIGDMGENETAAFDPLFFFHHCNIDRIFWLWQVKYRKITKESLEKDYNSFVNEYVRSAKQINPLTNLGLATTDLNESITSFTTDLIPFLKSPGVYYNSNDVWNIYDLGYTYEDGSLVNEPITVNSIFTVSYWFPKTKKALQLEILRGSISGSILVQAFIKDGSSKWLYLGHYSIFSKWIITSCTNCQNTLNVNTFFQLPDDLVDYYNKNTIKSVEVKVIIKTRQGDIVDNNIYNIPFNETTIINNNFNPPLKNAKII